MKKRIFYLLIGTLLSSLGIAGVLHSTLGAFAITLTNKGLSQLFGVDIAVANFVTEGIMLLLALKYREGIGWTSIASMTLSGIFISFFDKILPYSPWLALLYFVAVIGWSFQGLAQFGHTASNILNEALMKCTGKSLAFIRLIMESIFLIIAWLTLPSMVNWFTILISFACPYAIKYIYKLFRYEPKEVEHSYLITFNKKKGASNA
jgi:uncharacterized membrane protein YczE